MGGEGWAARSLLVVPQRDWRWAGVVILVTTAAASLAALAASDLGGVRSTVLLPQPYLAPYVEFNANDGSAGPRHNHEALKFQAQKAGASQEWLQYSLHHGGSLQQAKRMPGVPRRAARAPVPGTRLAAAAPEAAAGITRAGDVSAGEAKGAKTGVIESSGSFQDDDGALFGQDTFDQAQASPGAAAMPYQQDDAGQYHQDEPGYDDYDDEYCEDENGNQVECDDEYCVDDEGYEVPCEEPEPQRPSDFLKSIVKAVAADEMPKAASKVLHKSINSVDAAKRELKRAAALKAAASIDEKRAEGLENRLSELKEYQHDKQELADKQEALAHKADAEYKAEEDEVAAMDVTQAQAGGGEQGVARRAGAHDGGGRGSDSALRHRLRRHLPLLRVVDKLVQRVGASGRPRGRHPRSRHELPAKGGVH